MRRGVWGEGIRDHMFTHPTPIHATLHPSAPFQPPYANRPPWKIPSLIGEKIYFPPIEVFQENGGRRSRDQKFTPPTPTHAQTAPYQPESHVHHGRELRTKPLPQKIFSHANANPRPELPQTRASASVRPRHSACHRRHRACQCAKTYSAIPPSVIAYASSARSSSSASIKPSASTTSRTLLPSASAIFATAAPLL